MANVFIEASTMTAIGDAIRAKTGGMAQIYPEDMPAQIASITTGGSGDGSDLVRYVTFLDEDGSELFKMPVLVGDDCKDPVTHGDISKPEKEDTNTIDYTHSGWTSTVGGTADADILKNVTEDKTVYVAYAVSTRYYTVNFYDEDGTTLLKTVEATYGQDLSDYVPVREGYDFVEWNPSVSNITSEFDTVAVWVESAKDEWDYIAESVAAGTYKTDYSIGYTAPVSCKDANGNLVSITMILVAFDHDDKADGSGKAAMSFVSKEALLCPKIENNGTAWDGSIMRTRCNYTIAPSLPQNVREQIKQVTKLSSKQDKSLVSTTDSVWALSETEAGYSKSSQSWVVDGQGEHYSSWFTTAVRRKAWNPGVAETSNPASWWTRSKGSTAANWHLVGMTGGLTNESATQIQASVRIGFCV